MKKFSIYHFLVAMMAFSLIMPAGVANAGKSHNASGEEPSEVTGSLTIHKFEQEPGSEQGNGDGSEITDGIVGDALEGVTFTLTQTHSYDPLEDEWTPVSGSPSNYVTDVNGQIVINNINLGRYTVQETAGPDNVVLNTEEYSVDIPMTSKDGENVNYEVHVYPKNEIIRGEVKLKKKDGDTNKKLKGVTFNLYDSEGNLLEEGMTTNKYGSISVGNLGYGDYYFQETATVDGYLINGEKVNFSITEQGQEEKVSLNNYKKPEIDKDVDKNAVNRGEEVTYTLTVNLPGDINEYDSFTIIDELDANLEYVNNSESSPTGFTFNQNGQTLTWEKTGDLNQGNVDVTFKAKVSEDAPANEKIFNEGRIVYHNGYEAGGDKSPNVPVLPTAGLLKVLKQDGDTKHELGGATFELRDLDGNKISSGTTGDNGVLDFGEIDYGNYQLVETKAPEGYTKLRNPIDVTVDAEHNEQTITVDNFESGWELPKTGGIGTLLFTLVGLTLMGSAAFLFIRRRRGSVTTT